jgi:hypothetical protein
MTRQWVDAVASGYEREVLQEMNACLCDGPNSPDGQVGDAACCTLDEQAVEKIPRGLRFRENRPTTRERKSPVLRSGSIGLGSGSLYEWKGPSEALAYAWSCLLVLIGWRR